MSARIPDTRAAKFFDRVTAHPKTVIVVSVVLLLAAGSFLPRITKDSRNMSNIDPRHPARLATERVEELFGLSSSSAIMMAVVNDGPHGVFTPGTLGLVDWLTDRIMEIDGVEPTQVSSLATEKDIVGTDDDMLIRHFFEEPPATQTQADAVAEAVMDFALYVDRLVSGDRRATAIFVELLDADYGPSVYDQMMRLAERAPTQEAEVYVAGVGAFNARIGEYIESDAKTLNPLAALVIVLMMTFAYRTVRGVFVPLIAVVGAVVGAFGVMAAVGVPVYTVTNTMSVILIAIGVADGIHILGQYYAELARTPDADRRELVVRTMLSMWRPVLVTSLTTMAGLMAVSAVPAMPPMKWYGLFASLGVLSALLLCVFTIPALLAVLRPKPSRAFLSPTARSDEVAVDRFGRLTARFGRFVCRNPARVLLATAGLIAVAGLGASRLHIDNSALNYLDPEEPLHIAQKAIEKHLGGMFNLDLVVETDEPGALYEPVHLRRIEAMQRHVETLPHVVSTTSIVDYVKQMHKAMHADDPAYFVVPEERDLVAQYFLTYTMSSSPSDFDKVVDYGFQRANVRVGFDRGQASATAATVAEADRYVRDTFNTPAIRASLAGWANISWHWLSKIANSQLYGVPLAFLAVATIAAISFRSVVAGLLSVMPVAVAVLFVYAVMGFTGTWLDLGNTALAALALGVTVDFSVHVIDRLITLLRVERRPLDEALELLFASTGRALLFNFAAIAMGFGVIALSVVPPLRAFGMLVVTCVTASFIASVTLLPALVIVLRPRFLGLRRTALVSSLVASETLERPHGPAATEEQASA